MLRFKPLSATVTGNQARAKSSKSSKSSFRVPTLSVVRVIAALCVVGLSGAVPRTVLPFLKVTLPAATMPGATVAVKVTAWPFWDGFNEETSLVVVTAFFTLRGPGEPGYLVEADTTQKIFTNPSEKRTEDYITGRFG